MVLPFQDDNLSIEYSQFRQDGLLKKKIGQNDFAILFYSNTKFFFFFPKITRTIVIWLEKMCLCSEKKK